MLCVSVYITVGNATSTPTQKWISLSGIFTQQSFSCERIRIYSTTHYRPLLSSDFSSRHPPPPSFSPARPYSMHAMAVSASALRPFYYFISLSVVGVCVGYVLIVVVCGRGVCWSGQWYSLPTTCIRNGYTIYLNLVYYLFTVVNIQHDRYTRLKRVNFNFVFYSLPPKMNFTVSSMDDHQNYNEFGVLRFVFRSLFSCFRVFFSLFSFQLCCKLVS